MKYIVPALLLLALSACDKEIPDENVNPPEAQHPGVDPVPTDGAGGSDDGDAGGAMSDASVVLPADGGGPMPPPPDEEFSKLNLLKAAGACAVAHYEAFDERAAGLVSATRAWADDVNAEQRSAARTALKQALASFQRAELFRFGPAARFMDDPGGSDLRDQIYAFPQNLVCTVDQTIVDKKYETDFASLLIGARGFTSLEYLTFFDGAQNSCSSGIGINYYGTWAALGETEIDKRRAAYAAASAADVKRKNGALLEAWSASGGKFMDKLTKTGSGKTYASEQAALNAVSHALFYLETEIKDWKLGLPLGLVEGCAATTCPNAVESRFARVSTDNLRQNLIGFRKLFQGCGAEYAGFGFDDWLIEVGAEDLATRMLAALTEAQRTVEALDPPLEEAIVSAPDRVRAVHTAVKALNDLLKTEFVSTLNLELPMGAEGDND